MSHPTLETPNIDHDLEQALDTVAAKAREIILLRGFPTGGVPARSVGGSSARSLSPAYAKRKVRMGRHPVSDQRFTSQTASALGVIRTSPGERVVGFRGRQAIASALHKRNAYFGLSEAEKTVALDSLRTLGAGFARRCRIRNPVIVIEVRT